LQHRWAEDSEKLSDTINPKIKYGGGEENIQKKLLELSKLMADLEARELQIKEFPGQGRDKCLDSIQRKIKQLLSDDIFKSKE
jgi:hypothetical protein